MSINQIRKEVDTLIQTSGIKPTMKMRCSIMRALKMRHHDIDASLTRDVITTAIKEMS